MSRAFTFQQEGLNHCLPLQASAYSGHVDLCQMLLDMGANVNATSSVSHGFSCLLVSSNSSIIHEDEDEGRSVGFAIECCRLGLMVTEVVGREGL